ncbi:MAG TPA: hypothetical protein VIM11_19790 [Tepidisphaeraceae bacterium]|jgi:predicted nucleic acid-binding protein
MRFIFIDSGPLGLLFQRAGIAPAEACRRWAKERLAEGARLIVPEIVHYEIRRELLRLAKTNSLAALDRFVHAETDRFRVVTSKDFVTAAEMWAESRRDGIPTADARALDIDLILCAQVRNSGIPLTDMVVATSNTKHIARFVPATDWHNA